MSDLLIWLALGLFFVAGLSFVALGIDVIRAWVKDRHV